MKRFVVALWGGMLAAVLAPTQAHVSLSPGEAKADATYRAVFGVGHGCDGSPTITIRVQIPEGMIAVKPMPKPGWELSTRVEPYAQPVKYFDSMLTEGVREVTWTGGSLPDDWYDEFVIRGRLPAGEPGTKLYFPVVQECEQGEHRWIDIPAEGRSADDYEEPAPAVTLTAPST